MLTATAIGLGYRYRRFFMQNGRPTPTCMAVVVTIVFIGVYFYHSRKAVIVDISAPIVCNSTRLCSHRGNGLPEGRAKGLLEGIHTLIKQGVDCFDFDVVQSQEGVLYVGHPAEIEKRLGLKAPVSGHKADDIEAADKESYIPWLADVLEVAESSPQVKLMFLEGKEEAKAKTLANFVARSKALLRSVSVVVLEADVGAIQGKYPDVSMTIAVRKGHELCQAEETIAAQFLDTYPVNIIAPSVECLSAGLIQSCNARKVQVASWIVDDDQTAKTVVQLGSHRAISNHILELGVDCIR